MGYLFDPAPQPTLPIAGRAELFPVRRIFCVGRNYVSHQLEMGSDGREVPFFFAKSTHALVPRGGPVCYPPGTTSYHHEVELVVAIDRQGRRIPAPRAANHVYGYGVGLDLTRRDLQEQARKRGRPWSFAKDFDEAAPCSELHAAEDIGHPDRGAIRLAVNGEVRQLADLADMVWSVPEQIAFLSDYYALEPGDLIYTGTPAGVGALDPGDRVDAIIEGVAELHVSIAPPR